jgi:signal transduction histidine kinase
MTYFDELRQFPPFADVPDNQLRWLADQVILEMHPDGTQLLKPGDAIDYLTIVLDGRLRFEVGAPGATEEFSVIEAPAVTGILPYSRLKQASSFMVAASPVRLLRMHRGHLRELTAQHYELTAVLVQQMTDRVRNVTQQAQQEEKMASLGRLSAGLAHELNNPVAAVVRNAAALKEHLGATPERFNLFMSLDITDEMGDAINDWLFRKIGQNKTTTAGARLSMLDRSRREDDLTDWLDDHGVSEAASLAGSLVEFDFTEDELEQILEQVGDDNLTGVLYWIDNNLVTEKMVIDIGEASQRIATLVKSIKDYTHMDRGSGKETVYLTDGIRTTLTLLNHKLRTKKIAVTVEIPDDLPTIQGWPGELNQVWTNLIDNAIDALPDTGGTLTIRAEPDRGQFVLTRIIDNGEGIPPDAQAKIFEPFFTTKPVGKGTGLGLDIVKGVVRHHNGSINVQSEPGRTEFRVCLPV